jgi:hypothetical protein
MDEQSRCLGVFNWFLREYIESTREIPDRIIGDLKDAQSAIEDGHTYICRFCGYIQTGNPKLKERHHICGCAHGIISQLAAQLRACASNSSPEERARALKLLADLGETESR